MRSDIFHKRAAALFEELDSAEALLRLEDFARLTRERRFQRQQPVAIRHLVLEIALVQRLHPHQGSRLHWDAIEWYADR